MGMTKKDLKMQRLQDKEAYDRLVKGYLSDPHHRVPRSRREFLSSGMMLMLGTTMVPTLSQLISSSAWAADCSVSVANNDLPAFINIQLAGGAALFAQHLAMLAGGVPMQSYATLGLGGSPHTTGVFSTNAPFWIEPDATTPQSGMIKGMVLDAGLPITDPIVRQTAFVAVAAESLDDTGANPNDLSGLIAAAGFSGSKLPHLFTGYGNSLAESTGLPANDFVGAVMPSVAMLKVADAAGLTANLKFQGAMAVVPDPKKLIKAIEDLTALQVEALANAPNSTESKKTFADLMKCATSQNSAVMASQGAVDFYSDATYGVGTNAFGTTTPIATVLKTIWAQNKSTQQTAAGSNLENQVTNAELIGKGLTAAVMDQIIARCGLVVANCLSGFSPAATINLGGFDYHASQFQRASAHKKDRFFGDILGRILKTAAAYHRPVFIHVSSDGSVGNATTATDATVNWNGENQKRGMNYMLAFDPTATNGPVTAGLDMGSYHDAAFQLNHFGADGAVSKDHAVAPANSPTCGAAIFYNFLQFAGKSDVMDAANFAAVKKVLTDGLPAGANLKDYYTRIKGRG